MDWPSQSTNKQMYTYSYRYIQQFHSLSITATACLIPQTVCFENSDYAMSNNTTAFCFTWSCSSNSELGTHTLQQVIHEPMQVYTTYNLYTVRPQPEGPTNTLTNCICIQCFYITACLNIVINFCSMPAMRLKQWVANKSDTLLCHLAHNSDITHAN